MSGWGGRREGAGRKPLGPPLRQVTVSLPVELVERLRRAGEGNVSAGIRRLLEQTGVPSDR
jgi:hypothetical protein